MTLRNDWVAAKNDSKAKFKLAVKAKKAALEKHIKEGDAKARKKALDDNLAELGIDGSDDVDKYFKFKEDLGPNLDKLEKGAAAVATAKTNLARYKTLDDLVRDAKLSKALGAFCNRSGMKETYAFITVGYKSDPKKAYDMFIKSGAPLEINVDGNYLEPLHAIAGNPAQLKTQGPGLLRECREALIDVLNNDIVPKFKLSAECKAAMGSMPDLAADKKRVTDTAASYRRQIHASDAKWAGISPDFRKPLIDALDAIDHSVATF